MSTRVEPQTGRRQRSEDGHLEPVGRTLQGIDRRPLPVGLEIRMSCRPSRGVVRVPSTATTAISRSPSLYIVTAMRVPSGDHETSDAGSSPSAIFRCWLPSAFMTQSSSVVASGSNSATYAMCAPSGDHAGENWHAESLVSRRRSVPSAPNREELAAATRRHEIGSKRRRRRSVSRPAPRRAAGRQRDSPASGLSRRAAVGAHDPDVLITGAGAREGDRPCHSATRPARHRRRSRR